MRAHTSREIWIPDRCQTYVTNNGDDCKGLLAQPGGRVAMQQWYAGRYPAQHAPLSLRFVDATPLSIGALLAPPPPEQQPAGNLDALLNEVRNMREETKSMFQAMTQRTETDAEANATSQEANNQRCEGTMCSICMFP